MGLLGRYRVTHPEVGTRFGRLTFVGEPYYEKERWYYKVRCECGKELFCRRDGLFCGHAQSCGCLIREISARVCIERNTTHGEAHKTPEYSTWKKMRERCTPGTKDSKNYADRGISVCARWQKYENFIADMGRRPSPLHTIERKDNDGNYEPDNCIWLHESEQQFNTRQSRRIQFNGQLVSLMRLGKDIGLNLSGVKTPQAIKRIQIRLFEQELARL